MVECTCITANLVISIHAHCTPNDGHKVPSPECVRTCAHAIATRLDGGCSSARRVPSHIRIARPPPFHPLCTKHITQARTLRPLSVWLCFALHASQAQHAHRSLPPANYNNNSKRATANQQTTQHIQANIIIICEPWRQDNTVPQHTTPECRAAYRIQSTHIRAQSKAYIYTRAQSSGA